MSVELTTAQHLRTDRTSIDDVGARALTLAGPTSPTSWQLFVKRSIDIFVGVVGIVFTLPIALVVALIVKVTSPGPVFFVQERLGRNGRPFKMVKFRTMVDGTHQEVTSSPEEARRYAENQFKLPDDDPRITRFGRLLRKSSLDELPQLLNVVLGQMSLVGIRPMEAGQVALRSDYDQDCYRLLRPGLTGLWQVAGRSTITDGERRMLDRTYIVEWSLWSDVKILLRTPLAVLRVGHTT